jgi:prepilin-type N-terminal cleavage/methylation domain-containing protein
MQLKLRKSGAIMPKKNHHQKGFTLIELMIVLLIGMFLLGGVISALVVNQQTVNTKTNLDNTQEALRFSVNTVSRVVRQADSLNLLSTGNQLVVTSVTGVTGLKNCLGQDIVGLQLDIFRYANNQLLCNNTPLVDDVTGVSFLYGADTNNDGWVSNSEYTATPLIWRDVNSVRVLITLTNGKTHTFTATVRSKLTAKYS